VNLRKDHYRFFSFGELSFVSALSLSPERESGSLLFHGTS